MTEYIEREAVKEAIGFTKLHCVAYGENKYLWDVINEIPVADVAPVVHGHWDENGRCTACGGHAPFWCMASTYYKSPFCHECGAKMDEEDKT